MGTVRQAADISYATSKSFPNSRWHRTSCYIITPTIDARLVGDQLIHENVFTSLPLCPESHRLARYYTPMPVSRNVWRLALAVNETYTRDTDRLTHCSKTLVQETCISQRVQQTCTYDTLIRAQVDRECRREVNCEHVLSTPWKLSAVAHNSSRKTNLPRQTSV